MDKRSFIKSLAVVGGVTLSVSRAAVCALESTGPVLSDRSPLVIGIGAAGMRYLVALSEREGSLRGGGVLVACQAHDGWQPACNMLVPLGVRTLDFPWSGEGTEISLALYVAFFESAIRDYVKGYDAVEVFASPVEMEGCELGPAICRSVQAAGAKVRLIYLP
jgi:hypothetical protein